MSTQSFKNAFREALWETHGKKCFYCGRELLLRDMQIDHVVPEYINNNAAERVDLLKKIGLDDAFSITGLENLVPSCSRCNGDKGGALLHVGSVAIQLAKVRDRIPQLKEALKQQRAERDLEDILREIARAVEKGRYSPNDLISRLEELRKRSERALAETLKQPASTPGRITFQDGAPSKKMLFSFHALGAMREREMTVQQVYGALFSGIREPKAAARLSGRPDTFSARGLNGIEVIYEVHDNQILIRSVQWTVPR